jgi:hypothetical protein
MLDKFREDAGRGMSSTELQEALRLPETDLDTSDEDEWRYRRWLREQGMETIVKGALRLAAHNILDEEPHFGGKYSKDVIEDGIKTLEELKRRPTPSFDWRPQQKEDGLARRVDLGPPEAADTPKRRSSRARNAFSQGDLRGLRRAIKAKDQKRIDELTSKIGKPTFDE